MSVIAGSFESSDHAPQVLSVPAGATLASLATALGDMRHQANDLLTAAMRVAGPSMTAPAAAQGLAW